MTTNHLQDIDTLTAQLEELEKLLSEKDQQLQHIRSLLNAPRLAGETATDLHAVEELVTHRLIPFFEQLEDFPWKKEWTDKVLSAFQSWINLKQKPWLENKTVIAVMGRFSSGKSSLINTLLGDELLPVDVNEMTAVPTYISWGKKSSVKYTDPEDKLRAVEPELFKHFSHQSFKTFKIAGIIRHFIVEHPLSSLKRISILDTPGYDSVDTGDRAKTLGVLNESHHIFWVMDINDGDISENSLRFIRENVHSQKLYFVLSKADQKPESSRKQALEQIEKTLRRQGIQFESCLLFSNKMPLLQTHITSMIYGLDSTANDSLAGTVSAVIEALKDFIRGRILGLKATISDAENEKDQLDGEIGGLAENLNSDREHMIDMANSMTYAMNNQFEDGFFNVIVLRHGELIDTYNRLVNAINATNTSCAELLAKLDDVARFGSLSALIEINKGQLTLMETAKKGIAWLRKDI